MTSVSIPVVTLRARPRLIFKLKLNHTTALFVLGASSMRSRTDEVHEEKLRALGRNVGAAKLGH